MIAAGLGHERWGKLYDELQEGGPARVDVFFRLITGIYA